MLFEMQKHFNKKNAFENIFCDMTAILSRPHCVKPPNEAKMTFRS